MKHHTEVLISIGIVVVAVVASIIRGNDIAPDTTGNTDMQATTTTPPPDDQKQRCLDNTILVTQTIRESLALINTLDPKDISDRKTLEQHIERVEDAKRSLGECQTLIRDYEEKVEALEDKIKTLQSTP